MQQCTTGREWVLHFKSKCRQVLRRHRVELELIQLVVQFAIEHYQRQHANDHISTPQSPSGLKNLRHFIAPTGSCQSLTISRFGIALARAFDSLWKNSEWSVNRVRARLRGAFLWPLDSRRSLRFACDRLLSLLRCSSA